MGRSRRSRTRGSAAVRDNTKAFYGETIGNPAGNVLDIETLAAIAHEHELPLLVDNTFATPYLCRPIEWGADIVLHSATKFIGGHGTSIGGVVVDSGTFNWSNGRFPVDRRAVAGVPRPAVPRDVRHLRLPDEAARRDAARPRRGDEPVQRLPVPAGARDAVAADGAPRRERARRSREFLADARARVERHATRACPTAATGALVDKYLPRGAGAVFSFDCQGGRDAGQDFIRGLSLWSHLANVGDAKSLVIHPASTTHRQLSDDELRAAGVGPGTIRLSVGIEIGRRPDLGSRAGLRQRQVGARAAQRQRGGGAMTPPVDAPPFDLTRYQDPLTIQRVLHHAKTIAIVGLSPNELRASYFVGYYLKRHGYR